MNTAAQRKILVVDDDLSVRTLLGRVLAEEGYGVDCAADENEALQRTQQSPPDLVLLDLSLTGKNGWELFEKLANCKPLTPIVVVTGKANQLFTALSAGAGALLEKPLHFPKLLQTVRALLSESSATRNARLAGKPADFHYLPAWHSP